MKTTDFNKQKTSLMLETNLSKQFGTRVNLEQYGREQLEDFRNKLRTRIFQQEGSAGINDLLTNETYQKDKAMLELLNTRIKEMLGEQMKQLRDRIDQLTEGKKGVKVAKHPKPAKGAKPDYIDLDKDGNKKEPMKKAAKDAKVKEGWDDMMKSVKDKAAEKGTGKFDKKQTTTGTVYTKKDGASGTEDPRRPATTMKSKKTGKPMAEGTPSCGHTEHTKGCKECAGMWESKKAKPDFLDMDKDGNKKEPMKKAVADKKKNPFGNKKNVKESFNQFKHNVRFVNESINVLLNEDEEGKAKTITAAGDMVNDFTSWMQRVGQYQTKAIIELADSIRADFGAAQAEAFKQSVGPALSATLETLTQQREAISNAVASLAGESIPENPMGMEPDMGADMDTGAPDDLNPDLGGDEFGAADAAAGGDAVSGREMRESREDRKARKLNESHNILIKLAK
jgi:hypothetical protein